MCTIFLITIFCRFPIRAFHINISIKVRRVMSCHHWNLKYKKNEFHDGCPSKAETTNCSRAPELKIHPTGTHCPYSRFYWRLSTLYIAFICVCNCCVILHFLELILIIGFRLRFIRLVVLSLYFRTVGIVCVIHD